MVESPTIAYTPTGEESRGCLGAIERQNAPSSADIGEAEIAERLQWLLRLRWLIVPVFVIVDLVTALLVHRRAPWTTLVVGGVLIAANALYSLLLARRHDVHTLLRWARFEAAVVTAIPVIVVGLHGDPTNALRYGVLVGVVAPPRCCPAPAR